MSSQSEQQESEQTPLSSPLSSSSHSSSSEYTSFQHTVNYSCNQSLAGTLISSSPGATISASPAASFSALGTTSISSSAGPTASPLQSASFSLSTVAFESVCSLQQTSISQNPTESLQPTKSPCLTSAIIHMVVCLVLAGLRSGVADIVCVYFTHCSVRLNADHLIQVKHHTNLVEEQASLLAISKGVFHKS